MWVGEDIYAQIGGIKQISTLYKVQLFDTTIYLSECYVGLLGMG